MTVPNDHQPDGTKSTIAAGQFPLVRWLSITSLMAMLITAAILILLYRQDQLAEFEKNASEENERILLHLIYALDDPINSFIVKCEGQNFQALQANPNLDSLFASELERIREHGILKLKLYNLSGTVVYSSVKSEIGGLSSHPGNLAKAMQGTTVSQLGHRDTFTIASGELHNVNVFETYLPLFHEGKLIGVIESYDDAASIIERLQQKTFQIILVVFGAFAGLYTALFFSVLRADSAVVEWKKITAEFNEKIHNMAFYDALTQLPNRRLLEDRLAQTIAASKRSGFYGALLFLDLDNFKPLNDTHGHGAGDLLLVEVSRRINSCVREVDTVARFGGDEFVVVLSVLDADKDKSTIQASIVAEKIRAALSEPYVLNIRNEGEADASIEHHCTSSIGVVLFINHEARSEHILKCADIAMYQAKEAGRNSIRFYDADV